MFIKRAAILYNPGGIIEGQNYGAITNLARRMGITGNFIFGFTDSSDNFVDTNRALDIAKQAGQIDEDFVGPMYPEDIFAAGENDNAID